MIRVRWTPEAADDLAAIVTHIKADSPDAAARVAHHIFQSIARLSTLPNRGRLGLVPNTRELVFAPWPYIVVYEVKEQEVRVLRIRHAAQDWP